MADIAPWTVADIKTLKAAIATGSRRIRYSDGREIEYNSTAQMMTLLAFMTEQVVGDPTKSAAVRLAKFTR